MYIIYTTRSPLPLSYYAYRILYRRYFIYLYFLQLSLDVIIEKRSRGRLDQRYLYNVYIQSS